MGTRSRRTAMCSRSQRLQHPMGRSLGCRDLSRKQLDCRVDRRLLRVVERHEPEEASGLGQVVPGHGEIEQTHDIRSVRRAQDVEPHPDTIRLASHSNSRGTDEPGQAERAHGHTVRAFSSSYGSSTRSRRPRGQSLGS
jgi:hypothetical protein